MSSRKFDHLKNIDDIPPARLAFQHGNNGESAVEAINKGNKDAAARDRRNMIMTLCLIILTIIVVIQAAPQSYKPQRVFYNIVGHGHGPINRVVKPWINEVEIDTFNGKIMTSKVSTVTDGWNKKKIWLIIRKYENGGRQDLTISGISDEDKICTDDDSKIDIQIKMGEEMHTAVPTRLSKSKASLIFDNPEVWMKKIGNVRKFNVRVDDECGVQTNFTFRTKRVIDFAKP